MGIWSVGSRQPWNLKEPWKVAALPGRVLLMLSGYEVVWVPSSDFESPSGEHVPDGNPSHFWGTSCTGGYTVYTYIIVFIHTYTYYVYIYWYIISCEWELDYSMTHVPTYIAIIFPQPRVTIAAPLAHVSLQVPRENNRQCRSCAPSFVVVVDNRSFLYQQGTHTHISERISDSQVISRRSPTEPTSG